MEFYLSTIRLYLMIFFSVITLKYYEELKFKKLSSLYFLLQGIHVSMIIGVIYECYRQRNVKTFMTNMIICPVSFSSNDKDLLITNYYRKKMKYFVLNVGISLLMNVINFQLKYKKYLMMASIPITVCNCFLEPFFLCLLFKRHIVRPFSSTRVILI